MGRESSVRETIRQTLRQVPELHFVPYAAGPYGVKGTPDILGCYQGRMFAIETKRKNGSTIAPAQAHQLHLWREAGARVGVARTVAEALAIITGSRGSGAGSGIGRERT